MNSLVAYEDSDSDTESTEDGNIPTRECDTQGSTHYRKLQSQPNQFNQRLFCEKQVNPGSLGKNANIMDSVKKTESTTTQDTSGKHILPLGTVNELALVKSNLNTQKRPSREVVCSQGVVKPYVPKRLRQEQLMANEEECGTSNQMHVARNNVAQNMFRTSDYLRPHLYSPYKSSEVPRNLVFQMSEHKGAVNRVQWCPVQQYSHLLLSASMDSTLKIWDAVDSGVCLSTYSCHSGAVRDAQWSECGHKIGSGGFDSMLYIMDVETGKHVFKARNEFKINTVRFRPNDPNILICGGFFPALKAWDIRSEKVIRVYKDAVQQHLSLLFLHDGKEFLSTTDAVSRDSADRTIIAWDFETGAKISNQIFHERYTCPSLALHPRESTFAAQTNGNYIALFSSQRPYKMNKKKKYEGHKVEGYAVGCEFSPDGSIVVTGSSEGTVYFYNYHTSRTLRSLQADRNACISVTFHPVLPSLLAASYWDGCIRVWQ
ncbi:WD repeat-containing protein 25 [Bombina bombina]|uniref:WD repeat-containing protein 25 n=1 Tax=Bombina bombina TaxID=8345 RepID=UPI00235AFC8B|nr:WD repeat-containing protein 25 [Bombina bombina]